MFLFSLAMGRYPTSTLPRLINCLFGLARSEQQQKKQGKELFQIRLPQEEYRVIIQTRPLNTLLYLNDSK